MNHKIYVLFLCVFSLFGFELFGESVNGQGLFHILLKKFGRPVTVIKNNFLSFSRVFTTISTFGSEISDFIYERVLPEQGASVNRLMLLYPYDRYIGLKKIAKSIYGEVFVAFKISLAFSVVTRVVIKKSYWDTLIQEMNPLNNRLENPFKALKLQMMLPPHENIAQIIEVSIDAEAHWIVTEYCGEGIYGNII